MLFRLLLLRSGRDANASNPCSINIVAPLSSDGRLTEWRRRIVITRKRYYTDGYV